MKNVYPTAMSPILTLFLIAPVMCGRLIVAPQAENEWDSLIVSSDPIKVTEGKKSVERNETLPGRKPDYTIRLNRDVHGDVGQESRSTKNCKYNDITCLHGTEEPKIESDNQEIIDRFLKQYSSITNAKFATGPLENRTDPELKSYWNGGSSQRPSHPFDDKKGWVTLETVPWSTSTVSKWQANVQPTHPSPSNFDQDVLTDRPSSGHHSDEKPWQYGGIPDRPTPQTWSTNRPSAVTTNYGSYTPVSNHFPQTKPHWAMGNNDIITDNRPTNFPLGNGGYQPFQNNFQTHSPPNQQAQHIMTTQPVLRPTRYPPVNRHPSTYPDAGNGEWILLSTTKGYSAPNGYRGSGKTMAGVLNEVIATESRRLKYPEISRYHEEEIDSGLPNEALVSDRKSDVADQSEENDELNLKGLRVLHTENGSSIYAAAKNGERTGRTDWNMEEAPLQILFTSSNEQKQPGVTLRRSVRLHVLPPISNTTALSHDGLLEVDSNFQPVEEHKAMEEEKIKQLSKIAKVRRGNFTLFRVIPAPAKDITGRNLRQKSTAVLAAVGAGMIPATMAVLVPMALGRKKRSLSHREYLRSQRHFPAFP